jgi:carbon monoxide dehydrogenase subunit G
MAGTITFGGKERFTVEPQRLFDTLTDLDNVAAMIPDIESSSRPDPQTLACVVRPGFSFLRGTLKLQVRVSEQDPPEQARMEVRAQGIGISMLVDSRLAIAAADGGSELTWEAEVREMKGLIATVSSGLIRAAADQVIRDAWRKMHERLGG